MISPDDFLYFFKKKYSRTKNDPKNDPIKILTFLLAHFNSFFNKQLFFKLINKDQTEVLRCVPPSSYVCDFLVLF